VRIIKLTRLPRDKDAQVDITVREMIRICQREVWSEDVRWLLHHVRLPFFTRRETAARASAFIRETFPFELDPEDVELLRTPAYYAKSLRARRRPASGDCDDFALLLATLIGAMGIEELGFVVMARRPGAREPFGHVFVTAKIDGKLEYYDPSVSQPYSTAGLRRKVYPIPSTNFPPQI